jgi:serine protease Do/serine protease DegQ
LPIVLGSLNEKTASITGVSSPIKGVSLRLIDQEARDEYSIPEDISGVLVSEVDDDSPFVEILEKGMVILEVNGASIRSVEQIESNLSEGQNMLYIWAKGTKGFMVIKQ